MVVYRDVAEAPPIPMDDQQRCTQLCSYNILDTVSTVRSLCWHGSKHCMQEQAGQSGASACAAVGWGLWDTVAALKGTGMCQSPRLQAPTCLVVPCAALHMRVLLQEPEEAYDRISALCRTLFNVSALQHDAKSRQPVAASLNAAAERLCWAAVGRRLSWHESPSLAASGSPGVGRTTPHRQQARTGCAAWVAVHARVFCTTLAPAGQHTSPQQPFVLCVCRCRLPW